MKIAIRYLLALFYCLCLLGKAFSESDTQANAVLASKENISFKVELQQHGSIKNETAYRVSHPTKFTKLKNQLILSETGNLAKNIKFKLSGRFYYDAVYDLTDNFAKNVASDQQDDAELRETYIDYSNGPFDLRLGKQQIVWGEAVGLFFADVVNAKDLRESVLPDFDMIRIPQWGTDLEYSKQNFHAEFVWLPILEFNKFGVTGSEFAFPYPVPENTSYVAQDPNKPKDSFRNSELGCRLSYFIKGWDISTFYMYTWDKSPVMYRSIESGVYYFLPRYKRLNIVGTTFSKEIKDIVLKGEFVFNRKGHFSIIDDTDKDGIKNKDFIDYLLGMDYTFFDKIDTNIQFMQRIIFDYDKRLLNEDEIRNSVSFRLTEGFLNNNLELEFLIIASLMEKDFLYRPKITYNFYNNWKLRLGLDIFQGESSGVFGKFEKKSRIYSEITYSF